jgi:hypothetical protein
MHEMNLEKIIDRACEMSGANNEAQLCQKMEITQSGFGNRKRRGTAHELIFAWAVKNNYDLNYLFYGVKNSEKSVDNEALLKIQDWLDDVDVNNKDFKIWFKVQFESKFPEFIEWKKRKEGAAGQNNLPASSKVANDNSK